MSKRPRPTSIRDALKRPAVDLMDIAAITGLSYGTLIGDVRLGELHALARLRNGRHCYRVTRGQLAAYLTKLGYPVAQTAPNATDT